MNKKKYHRFLGKFDGHKHAWLRGTKEFVSIFVVAVIALNLMLGISRVDGDSMEPTLQNGDIVFYSRIGKNYEVGDIVFARMPSGDYYVKRIVAEEGDVVALQDGVLYINGEPESGDYMQGTTQTQDGIVRYPYTVESGKYFMVGDNREYSMDSRSFGALMENQIKGKLVFY